MMMWSQDEEKIRQLALGKKACVWGQATRSLGLGVKQRGEKIERVSKRGINADGRKRVKNSRGNRTWERGRFNLGREHILGKLRLKGVGGKVHKRKKKRGGNDTSWVTKRYDKKEADAIRVRKQKRGLLDVGMFRGKQRRTEMQHVNGSEATLEGGGGKATSKGRNSKGC